MRNAVFYFSSLLFDIPVWERLKRQIKIHGLKTEKLVKFIHK